MTTIESNSDCFPFKEGVEYPYKIVDKKVKNDTVYEIEGRKITCSDARKYGYYHIHISEDKILFRKISTVDFVKDVKCLFKFENLVSYERSIRYKKYVIKIDDSDVIGGYEYSRNTFGDMSCFSKAAAEAFGYPPVKIVYCLDSHFDAQPQLTVHIYF